MPNAILTRYASSAAVTCTLASLASDTNLLSGRESAEVDNTSNGYQDYICSGFVTTGTSPTAAKQIEVWAIGYTGDDYPDVFDGTDSAETITSDDIKNSVCVPVAIMSTNATSDRTYPFRTASIRGAFGGVLPSKFALFVVHNTGAALNATAGNHELRVQGVNDEVQ